MPRYPDKDEHFSAKAENEYRKASPPRTGRAGPIRIVIDAHNDYASCVDSLRFISGLSSSWRSNTSKRNLMRASTTSRLNG